jgi:uncharacterized RDD family membrane protein YckC
MLGPDEVRIETPEQIDLALEPAGLGSRFVARMLDTLVQIGIVVLVAIPCVILLALAGISLDLSSNLALGYLAAVFVLVLFLVQFVYDIYFELRNNGQTPGKSRAGIRVMRDGGAPVDFWSSCIRNILRVVDLLPAAYLGGALLILLSSRRQRLGDFAAGTVVIRERSVGLPDDMVQVVEKYASDEFVFTTEQISACSPSDRHVLRSYFQRHRDMEMESRRRLARQLAKTFCTKTGYQPDWPIDDGHSAEAFLASLYRDLDSWARQGRK